MIIPLEIGFTNLHNLLRGLYSDMLPLCSQLTGVAKGIAAIGALLYVSYRVWQALARAEPIDVFPLLRPFAIGIAILFFPTLVLGGINTIMSPVVTGCHNLLENQVFDMNKFQQQKDEAEQKALANVGYNFLVENAEYDKKIEDMGWSAKNGAILFGLYKLNELFSFRAMVVKVLRILLEFLFEAASLIIDTIRTFFLIILAIFGPLSFAFSVYDGFQHTLAHWICRYICVYLWLPISDVFGAILSRIQILTLQYDLANITDPFSQGLSSITYLLFLLIGIAGFCSIPTVSTWIIQCAGMGGYLRNISQGGHKVANTIGATAGAVTGTPIGAMIH